MKRHATVVALMACAGCFTLHESEYPEVQMTPAGEKAVAVQLSGFEAFVTTYVPIYGYETVYRRGGGYRHPGYWWPTTIATETYVPQTSRTTGFVDRATELLESGGFNVRAEKPDYRIEVKFAGPFVTDGDRAVSAAWTILSLLSADYGVQTWTAKLKIYEVGSGRLLFRHDYMQRYQSVVWGPIPLFSAGGSDKTSPSVMQNWCLTALTDQAMADASAFLVSRK